MEQQQAIEEIDQLFQSVNGVPVTRATITREQWEAVKSGMEMTDHKKRMACLNLFSGKDFDDMRKHPSATRMLAMTNMEMTEERVREILGIDGEITYFKIAIQYSIAGQKTASIRTICDSIDNLEAVAFLMRRAEDKS